MDAVNRHLSRYTRAINKCIASYAKGVPALCCFSVASPRLPTVLPCYLLALTGYTLIKAHPAPAGATDEGEAGEVVLCLTFALSIAYLARSCQ